MEPCFRPMCNVVHSSDGVLSVKSFYLLFALAAVRVVGHPHNLFHNLFRRRLLVPLRGGVRRIEPQFQGVVHQLVGEFAWGINNKNKSRYLNLF